MTRVCTCTTWAFFPFLFSLVCSHRVRSVLLSFAALRPLSARVFAFRRCRALFPRRAKRDLPSPLLRSLARLCTTEDLRMRREEERRTTRVGSRTLRVRLKTASGREKEWGRTMEGAWSGGEKELAASLESRRGR